MLAGRFFSNLAPHTNGLHIKQSITNTKRAKMGYFGDYPLFRTVGQRDCDQSIMHRFQYFKSYGLQGVLNFMFINEPSQGTRLLLTTENTVLTLPSPGARLQLTTENTVLTLPSLSSLDTGSYTVSATNSHGTGSLTFNVAMSSGNPSGPISIVPVQADITAEVR